MIYAIGVDAVEVKRFHQVLKLPDKRLLKIFTLPELAYVRDIPAKAAERIAIRFAAKEAFLKALSSGDGALYSLFTISKLVSVAHTKTGAPTLIIDWKKLNLIRPSQKRVLKPIIHLSLTHSAAVAAAFIVLELK